MSYLKTAPQAAEQESLLIQTKIHRKASIHALNPQKRSELGQFFTPPEIAEFMASLFLKPKKGEIKILDPGAGMGILSTTLIVNLLTQNPQKIHLDCYEIEPNLIPFLEKTREINQQICSEIPFHMNTIYNDFIHEVYEKEQIVDTLFADRQDKYSHCIINPPYKKISSLEHKEILKALGIQTTNLYTAFLQIAIELLGENGEVVAIVPRSFCNGTYFKSFREFLIKNITITHIHTFNQRNKAFSEDRVLQENIIFHGMLKK